MSFRRMPFQFTSSDPVERQRELEKRFGLPTRSKMYVENTNPLSMGTGFRDHNASSSPRLQHRVPIFVEGYDQPIKSSVDSVNSMPESKKPNVRVIPIEIEDAETRPSTRQRTFSGPAGLAKQANETFPHQRDDATSPLKRSMQDLTKPSKLKTTTGPRVYNIPIKVEGGSTVENKPKSEKVKSCVKKNHSEINGCDVSKHAEKVKPISYEQHIEEKIDEQQNDLDIDNLLKKIESILEEFKSYESGVQEFNGTVKDKQYRYLDEMLTRCMLRLDNIDTRGNEKVRSARKNAVKKVQSCVDLLENKINALSESSKVSIADTEAKDNNNEVAIKVLEQGVKPKDLDNEVADEISGQDSAASEVQEAEVDETKILEHNVSVTDNLEEGSEVSQNVDMSEDNENAEVNDVEMVKITNAMPENNAIESTLVKSEPLNVPLTDVSDLKALGSSTEVNVDESCEVPEVEMKEALSQDTSSENQQISQDKDTDIEMKEIRNTVNEIKEKAACDSGELQNIQIKELAGAGSEMFPSTGQCNSQLDCSVDPPSSQSDNLKEIVHKD